MDENDFCWECTGYGDDYYLDDNGELQSACDSCPARHYWRGDE